MPIYEYLCPLCGCEFEIRQSFEDRSLVRCPKCKATAERKISSFSFTFSDGPPSQVHPRARRVKA